MRKLTAMTHRVAVLALDGVMPFDLGIPARVFNEAHDASGRRLYQVLTCSLDGGPVRTSEDFSIQVDHDHQLLQSADTVIIATQEPSEELRDGGPLPSELAAAIAAIPEHTRVVSLCTSAFVLAAAGLLDGLNATTHWALSDAFATRFPQVAVDPDVLFVDNGRVLTSAGGAAAIDLCLYLVRQDHGAAIANTAARHCVVAPWRDGGQAQFIERPVPDDTQASTTPTQAWAIDNLHDPLSVADLADHARMSPRTFARRFRAEVGETPAQWLIQRRIESARRMLETTDLTVDQIASAAGFGSTTLLRKHLHATVGLPPVTYRRRFSAIR